MEGSKARAILGFVRLTTRPVRTRTDFNRAARIRAGALEE